MTIVSAVPNKIGEGTAAARLCCTRDGNSDPGFQTHTLSPRATYTHHVEGLAFVTGGAWLSYDLSLGKTYRVLAVYRPAGPHGPGFTSQETNLEIPQ